MLVRNGAVTPGLSREYDITFFVKGQPKSARQSRDSTVAARRSQSVTVPSSRVSRECPPLGLRSPHLKKCPIEVPDLVWKSQMPFSQTSAASLSGFTLKAHVGSHGHLKLRRVGSWFQQALWSIIREPLHERHWTPDWTLCPACGLEQAGWLTSCRHGCCSAC